MRTTESSARGNGTYTRTTSAIRFLGTSISYVHSTHTILRIVAEGARFHVNGECDCKSEKTNSISLSLIPFPSSHARSQFSSIQNPLVPLLHGLHPEGCCLASTSPLYWWMAFFIFQSFVGDRLQVDSLRHCCPWLCQEVLITRVQDVVLLVRQEAILRFRVFEFKALDILEHFLFLSLRRWFH